MGRNLAEESPPWPVFFDITVNGSSTRGFDTEMVALSLTGTTDDPVQALDEIVGRMEKIGARVLHARVQPQLDGAVIPFD